MVLSGLKQKTWNPWHSIKVEKCRQFSCGQCGVSADQSQPSIGSAKVSQVSGGVRVWGLCNPEPQSIFSISRGRLLLQEKNLFLGTGLAIWRNMRDWNMSSDVRQDHVCPDWSTHLTSNADLLVDPLQFNSGFKKIQVHQNVYSERWKHNSRTLFKRITCCEILVAGWVGMGCLEKDGTLSLLASDLENLCPRSRCLL